MKGNNYTSTLQRIDLCILKDKFAFVCPFINIVELNEQKEITIQGQSL